MTMRASRTVVFFPSSGSITACNFLTKQVFSCSAEVVRLLSLWNDWSTPANAAQATGFEITDLEAAIPELFGFSALVTRDSELAKREEVFLRDWRWAMPAALMHFCVQDSEFITLEQSEEKQLDHLATTQQPELFWRNHQGAIRLPDPLNDLSRLMVRRRTNRSAAKPTITLKQLSDCLFAGMGITGWTENCAGKLPLSMTPSGGARNPYEAFVVARNVEGLDPGIYHYSAVDHDLGRLMVNHLPNFSELVGGQQWADMMPALIILCARLDRTMWKYEDANAYRVVLIEAGHIGQNIMLAATHNGLSACPTAALCHSAITTLVGLDRITDAPIYALTLAVPDSTAIH